MLAARQHAVRPGRLVGRILLDVGEAGDGAALREQRIALRPRLRANSVFAVRDAAIAGLGIASLPHVVAAEGVRRRQLRAVLADWSLPEVPVHAVFASRRFLTPKVRAFIDLAAEAMGGDKA